MAFKVKIKNTGKLADAEIHIGDFTVFAGPNNTGKSFVSKLLYSLFNAMNANHAETHLDNLLASVKRDLVMTKMDRRMRSDKATRSRLSSLENEIKKLETLVKEASIDDLDNENIILGLISQTEQMQQLAADIPQSFLKTTDEQSRIGQPIINITDERSILASSLAELNMKLHQTNAEDFIIAGIRYEIRQNLIRNFQVPNISDLQGEESRPSEVAVEDVGAFKISQERLGFRIDRSWLEQLQDYSRVIYLESPIYWKLKTALEDIRDYPVSRVGERERLSGVPGYFYDLGRALKFEYTGKMAFPDVYAKLTGEEVIGGRIAISETGDLSFRENGRDFSLPVTATGVANLGILALLIERKVLDEGSFLFIDEPEAHLHPAWQVIMAESLFELSRQGVNIAIATHSVDILKWLEVRTKKKPEDKQHIALNHFSATGVNQFNADNEDNAEGDFDTKMAKIKQELTKPFSDLYLEGL